MKLFLQKDAKRDLFIEVPQSFPQHQIDGIRFLYTQFKKKNPGVILNDPSGYGKRMQVILFLKCMKPLLQKPVLIICPKESIAKWREHFLEWADSYNDIALESSNAFAKHLVFINTIEDVSILCRRHWSIVIFENNDFHKDTTHITKKVLHLALKSEFKIWVTSVDIRAHLDLFPLIYHWLNPEDKTNIQDFMQKVNGLRDEIANLFVLEAFLEDIVIRRDSFLLPFKNTETEENHEDNLQEITRKRSGKCKDITGKKVKRSKKRVIEDDCDVDFPGTARNNSRVNVPEISISKDNESAEYFNFTIVRNNEVTENNEMDVETFIRDYEPVKSAQSNNANDVSQTESNTNDFLNAVNEIVKIENNISRDKIGSPSLNDIVAENKMEAEDTNESEDLKTESDKPSNIFKGIFKMPANNHVDLTIKKEEENVLDTYLNDIVDKNKTEAEHPNVSEDLKSESDKPSSICNGIFKMPVNNDVNLIIKTEEANVLDKIGENVNFKEGNCEEIVNKAKRSGNEKNKIKEEETNSNEVEKIVQVSVNKETESKRNAKKDIIEQISDLEKDALNKFKGSILDTLFKKRF